MKVTGKASHSALPHLGVNAVTYAGVLLGELARIEEELAGLELRPALRSALHHAAGDADRGRKGVQHRARGVLVRLGIRRLPGFDGEALDRRVRRFAGSAARCPCSAPLRRLASSSTSPTRCLLFRRIRASGVVPLALKLAEQNATFAVCYATEASLFQGGGAPSVVCGPGNIAQAHTPNEFVEVAELEKCLRFLGRIADWAEG